MNFDLTDEQQMLQGAAREFLAARLKSEQIRELAESDDAFDEDLWREMSELNWPGLMVSETYGGQELGTVELAVLMEQLGYALVPGPIFSSMLAAIALETAATDEQQERYLAPLATGEQRGTLALWDAGAGWTARRHHARARACRRRLHAARREAVRARRGDRRLLHRRRDRTTGGSSSSATPRASRSSRRRRSTRPASSTR